MKDKRKRVPVSCLNCKKRKVKCERGRPCAGCIKNNVPHLCVYLEPDWAQPMLKLVDSHPLKALSPPIDAVPFRASLESKINAQAEEIKCLRAQLEHAKASGLQAQPGNVTADVPGACGGAPAFSGDAPLALTVLAKLSTAAKRDLRVLKHGSYQMSGFKVLPTTSVCSTTPLYTIYLWLNIIKLDPQLTALWFRVTNLQKSYHLYKTSLLRKGSASLFGEPLMHSESTGSTDSNSCGHHKCPVVACEFNLMLEESENTLKKPALLRGPSSLDEMLDPLGARFKNTTQIPDALELLSFLQNMWGKIIGPASNSEPLSYSQLCFLISFYLDDFDSPGSSKETLLSNETESCQLFKFFKVDIISIFTKDLDSGQPYLNLGAFSPDMSDLEVITFLRAKAIFLCMLALIVEESLDRLSERQSLSNDLLFRLQSSFPEGIPGRKFAVLSHVSDTIQFLFQSSDSPSVANACGGKLAADLDGLLAMIVLLLANMNRLFSLYERQNTAVDYRSGISASFTKFVQLVLPGDQALQIWCDPKAVQLSDDSLADNDVMLGVLLCQVWCDFMRIVNHAIFNLIPVLNNSSELHESLEYFLNIMHATEKSASHKVFLEEMALKINKNEIHDLRACQIDDLLCSLKTSYLIARCSALVRNGISFHENSALAQPPTVSQLQVLVNDIEALSEDISLSKLRMLRFFEGKTILHYLKFYFRLVMFLQFEEVEDSSRMLQIIPSLFANALDINRFLQGSQSRLAKGISANYVLAIIADTLARMSHLICGILMRFKAESSEEAHSNKSQFMSSFSSSAQAPGDKPTMLMYSMMRSKTSSANEFETSVTLAEKDQVIQATDYTVLLLESLMPQENIFKKTKIWKFYMTFIRNAHDMNTSNFGWFHGEGFGPGKLLDRCPIMSGPSHELSATRDSMKCPVAHVPAWGYSHGSKRSHEQIKTEAQGETKKCPVAHIKEEESPPSPKRPPLGEGPGSAMETSQPKPYYAKYTPLHLANLSISPTHAGASRATPLGDPRPNEVMDWDSLPNFNFDFIGEEGLMLQINAGDFNNPRIENMFQ